MDQKILHEALLKPDAYPNSPNTVRFRETHISRLYFADDRVYKVKKPVDFGFLDFTSPEKRHFFCKEEVRLNRRLCPEIYLGVAEIRRQGNHIAFEGPGKVIDYAVVMKKMPEERLLSNLLAANDPGLPEKMEFLGRKIADFHSNLEPLNKNSDACHLDAIENNWRENFSQTAPFIDLTLSSEGYDLMRSWVDHFFREHRALLRRRQIDGYIRDGHGDLHCQHICFTENLCIYDCIEFNRRFRVADVLADLGFLLMDLEFRNRPDLADIVLDTYSGGQKITGETKKLLVFYKVYRAWVRGKVESFLSQDSTAAESTRLKAEARATRYFNLALGYLCPPVLVATCGLMGTGKTTVATALSRAIRGMLLRSDVLRKEIAGLSPVTKQPDGYQEGIYRPDFSERTYDLLLRRTRQALSEGRTVLVDASFASQKQREAFRRAAAEQKVPFLLLQVTCDRETILKRLDRRQSIIGEASDGRRELFDLQAEDFEPPTTEKDVYTVDTRVPVDRNVTGILCRLLRKTA